MAKDIGERINRFDNSLRTVESFNKIFPMNMLYNVTGNVDILEPVIGKEETRVLNINGTIIEHSFQLFCETDFDSAVSSKKCNKRRKGKMYRYQVLRDDGEFREYSNAEEVGKFLGITKGYVRTLIANGVTKYKNFNINRFDSKRDRKNGNDY